MIHFYMSLILIGGLIMGSAIGLNEHRILGYILLVLGYILSLIGGIMILLRYEYVTR